MTADERMVITQAINKLDLALMAKVTKPMMQTLVWAVREDLTRLIKTGTNLGETKNVHHEQECGK
jgi:hypothetical protein